MVLGMVLAGAGLAKADSVGQDFESFTLGDLNGQDGWMTGHGSSFCPVYDVEVVSNTYGYTSFGGQSLRISNAITCGSFNDQTFSKSMTDEAGETSAPTSGFSGGTRQNYFEAQWDFASTVPGAEQPGLSVVASPNRGDTMRMSWLQMTDTPTGLQLNFEDYDHSILNFVLTPIATGLDRTVPHTVKMTVQFVDGPSNDIVNVYLDGMLIHTGTTWEDYYRDFAGGVPFAVDSLMFRLAGTAAPSNSGKGFLIDNFSTSTGPVPSPTPPPPPEVGIPRDGIITVYKTVINDNGGNKTANDFPLFVNGTLVTSGESENFPPGTYTVSENTDPNYIGTFSGDCDSNGIITIYPGDEKECLITNDDVAPPPPPPIQPMIQLEDSANPSVLQNSPGSVMYTYTLHNVGTIPVSRISIVDSSCAMVTFVNGDSNGDARLDVNETWKYSCSAILSETHTSTVVATGFSSDLLRASDMASVTVVVSSGQNINSDKGLGLPPPGTSSICVSGTLMKLADDVNPATQADSTIYFCGVDGHLYVFPDKGTYFSWYKDFTQVQIVSQQYLASLTIAGNVTYKPGSLLKTKFDPKVYSVEAGGVLHWLTTEDVSRALYGNDWSKLVSDIDIAILHASYRVGDPITSPIGSPVPAPSGPACVADTAFTSYLTLGSTDVQVRQLQQLLQCLGFFPTDVAPSGYFGPETQNAVKKFQSANGIDPAGYVGPATRDALNHYARK